MNSSTPAPVKSDKTGCDVILVIAHPDDETFVSGTVRHLIEAGFRAKIICLTNGEGGYQPPIGAMPAKDFGDIRRGELLRSAGILGVHDTLFLNQADIEHPAAAGGWDITGVVSSLTAILERDVPDVILTHGPLGGYGSNAHKLTYRLVMSAVEKSRYSGAVLAFCGKAPGAFFTWHFDQPGDILIDVRRYLTRRAESLAQHVSQIGYFILPGFPKTIRKYLSALFAYTFYAFEMGRRRVPIGTPRRYFQKYPVEGLVIHKRPNADNAVWAHFQRQPSVRLAPKSSWVNR